MMMKIKYLLPILLTISFVVASCGDDEKPDDPVGMTDDDGAMTDDGTSDVTLTEAQEETTLTLTSGTQKTWRIAQATLNNSSGGFDISDNFNVLDDEFLFSGTRTNGTLEWRPGNDIDVSGGNSQETLLDFYKAPEVSTFSFTAESSTELSGINGRFTFTVVDENTIVGSLSFGNRAGETIDLTLTTKISSDYARPPSGGILFSEITEIQSSNIGGDGNVGLIGSYANNSLYFANREQNDVVPLNHRTVRIDLNTLAQNENNYIPSSGDFYTKRITVINNEVIIIGGRLVYTYDLDISSDPQETGNGITSNLSRFGSASLNNEIYITGGDLDIPANTIRKFNRTTNTLEVISTLPSPRVHADTEIVQNKLYVFGGRQEFISTQAETTSFIYDFSTDQIETFELPVALHNSYASRFENLIYVAGQTKEYDASDAVINEDIFLGVYDTFDGSFTEISHNLDDSDAFSSIHAMTVYNQKIYVIYGDRSRPSSEGYISWSIQAADLN